jgi:hypothetical protein
MTLQLKENVWNKFVRFAILVQSLEHVFRKQSLSLHVMSYAKNCSVMPLAQRHHDLAVHYTHVIIKRAVRGFFIVQLVKTT